MDGRSWPWKKKSSDKATTEKPVVGNESTNVSSLSYLASLESQVSLELCSLLYIPSNGFSTKVSVLKRVIDLY